MGKTVQKIILGYDPVISNLLPALKEVSAIFGYVSKNNAEKMADYFSVPLSKIYETASFYDILKIKSEPTLIIKVCSGANCAIKKSFNIIKAVENYFKIKSGDNFNPKVRLEIISCLGRCGEGPIVVINERVYERVTESSIYGILEEWV